MSDDLKAKVRAVNRAVTEAKRIEPLLRSALAPLVGKKVLKADGSLLKSVDESLPKFGNTNETMVYRGRSDYTLSWTVKVCEQAGLSHCLYHEETVYVANLRNGVLESLFPNGYSGRSDWTAEEVRERQAAYRAAQKAADDLRSALHPFGERF